MLLLVNRCAKYELLCSNLCKRANFELLFIYPFQMGWTENILEHGQNTIVLWGWKNNEGFQKIIQEFTFLLDSWSWPLRKLIKLSTRVKFLYIVIWCRSLGQDLPWFCLLTAVYDLWSWGHTHYLSITLIGQLLA